MDDKSLIAFLKCSVFVDVVDESENIEVNGISEGCFKSGWAWASIAGIELM